MQRKLTLAPWVPDDLAGVRCVCSSGRQVLRLWQPPLNLTDVDKPWRELKAARKAMADEARTWAREEGFPI